MLSFFKRFLFAGAVFVGAGLVSSGVEAAPLNLTGGLPDISVFFLDVSYDSTLDRLHITGTPFELDQDGLPGNDQILGASFFDIFVQLDAAGNASPLSSTDLQIGGTIGAPINATSPLLTGRLDDFGFTEGGSKDIFEFSFDVTGGSLSSLFQPTVGIIVSFDGFNGTFNADFASNGFGDGMADAFQIPLPAAFPAGLVLMGAIMSRRNARRGRAG